MGNESTAESVVQRIIRVAVKFNSPYTCGIITVCERLKTRAAIWSATRSLVHRRVSEQHCHRGLILDCKRLQLHFPNNLRLPLSGARKKSEMCQMATRFCFANRKSLQRLPQKSLSPWMEVELQQMPLSWYCDCFWGFSSARSLADAIISIREDYQVWVNESFEGRSFVLYCNSKVTNYTSMSCRIGATGLNFTEKVIWSTSCSVFAPPPGHI